MTRLELPRLRRDQWEIVSHPAKIKVLAMGRRWGKTLTSGAVVMTAAAISQLAVAWVVPTYQNGRPLWRFCEKTIAPLVKVGAAKMNKSDRTVEFQGGGRIGIYTAENPVSMLGEFFDLIVVDEAARVNPDVWYETLLPTLADTDGDALLISTPRPKNWFYQEYIQGLGDGVQQASWNAPTSANPSPNIRKAFELARERVSERTFKQEWMAEFLDDGGAVFRYVKEAAVLEAVQYGETGKRYIIGIDLGKSHDFTVFTVVDADEGRVVYWDYFNHVDYSTVGLERLKALSERFQDAHIWVEVNNVGQVFIELLASAGLPYTPFQTTNESKRQIIEALTVAFERREIQMPRDEFAIAQFEAFELETLPSGRLRFGAPAGMHDDIVMSTAIAWHGAYGYPVIEPFEMINF